MEAKTFKLTRVTLKSVEIQHTFSPPLKKPVPPPRSLGLQPYTSLFYISYFSPNQGCDERDKPKALSASAKCCES